MNYGHSASQVADLRRNRVKVRWHKEQVGVTRGDYAKPIDDANLLDMSEPITDAQTSAFWTACGDYLLPTHDINAGCASPSNSVAESSSEYFSTRIENVILKKKGICA